MAKKTAVSTPLILLQQLSRSLLRHFEEACEQALSGTQKVLGKLEKQRRKIEQRLREAELACQSAALAGKPKAQARARAAIDQLQATLDEVLDRQLQTHAYLAHLQRDVQTSLDLAQGIAKVSDEAGMALDLVTTTDRRPAALKAAVKRSTKPRGAVTSSAPPAVSRSASKGPTGDAAKPAASAAKSATRAARSRG